MIPPQPTEPPGYQCLFCGEAIASEGLDPCALHLVAKFDQPRQAQKEQTFYCHINCLRTRAASHPDCFYITDSDFPTIGEIEGEH